MTSVKKRITAAALGVCTAVLFCSCANSAQPSESAAPSESATASAAATETPSPEPTADLTLNADGTLDGMDYKYNSTWTETTDPLTSGAVRTYDIDLGTDGTVHLKFQSVNDEGTSAAVQNLRTQHDADRETVITSMITAKEGTLTGATSERASAPPAGTRAMWAYEGADGDQYVHGYSYVGGSQLYEVSVTTDGDASYAAFEPTWKSIINQLKFQDIEPVSTPEPTPTPTPKPTATPTPEIRSVTDPEPEGGSWMSTSAAQSKWENTYGYYDYTYSYSDNERYITFSVVFDDGSEFYDTLDRATGQWVHS